jgi:hypothetical protein
MPGSNGNQSGTTTAGNGQGSGTGNQTGAGGQAGTGSGIEYGTGDDPFADLRTGSAGGGGGEMSSAERIAILDARLEEGYGEFDEMILGENERGRGGMGGVADVPGGTGDTGTGTGSGDGDVDEPVILSTNSGGTVSGGGYMPNGTITNTSATGTFGNGTQNAAYEVPDDIPSGDDDDVVARQLREAAMNEPDPELREKLWDEYRAYTGLSE